MKIKVGQEQGRKAGIQARLGFKYPGSRIKSGMTAKNKCLKEVIDFIFVFELTRP